MDNSSIQRVFSAQIEALDASELVVLHGIITRKFIQVRGELGVAELPGVATVKQSKAQKASKAARTTIPKRVLWSHIPRVTGLSTATIYKLINAGEFPAPSRQGQGNVVGWDGTVIKGWLKNRPQA